MYTVVGAGSVGTVLAGLLADAGVEVALAGRGAVPDLRLEGDLEDVRVRVPVVEEPQGTILLCVHEPDVEGLCARWPGRTVATFQNGVRAEALAARHCRVIGAVWRTTCTLAGPGRARFTRRGRVVVGRHPSGIDGETHALAADLARAGLDVGVSEDIAADKWLKLLVNLASAPNALVRREDHGRPEFGEVKAAILAEGKKVLDAAGIGARSCDGRDPSAEEEAERQRRVPPRARPVFNSTWRQLERGLCPKELYHDVVVALARERGVPAPLNAAMLRLLRPPRPPGSVPLGELRMLVSVPPALVVFDLDDTLIDTKGVLLPASLRRVADALGIDAGRLDATGKRIDEVLAGVGGLSPEQRARAAAAWYDPEVPPLEPLPGAREVLAALRGRVVLCLLTRGAPERQRRKIARSGLAPLFDEVVIRAIEEPGTKGDDLRRLLDRYGLPADRCVVIGDDPRDELRHAAALGCRTLRVPDVPLASIPEQLGRIGLL